MMKKEDEKINEIWKPVKDYEGLYEVSNKGNVKSLNYNRTGKEKILKLAKNGWGYLEVKLCKNGKRKHFKVHRLVLSTFTINPNPKVYTDVNHIDEDKNNNCLSNLEWMSHNQNTNYGTRNQRSQESHRDKENCPIYVLMPLDGSEEMLDWFESLRDAEKATGIDRSNISACCRGKINSAGGFRWRKYDLDNFWKF